MSPTEGLDLMGFKTQTREPRGKLWFPWAEWTAIIWTFWKNRQVWQNHKVQEKKSDSQRIYNSICM